MSCFPILGFVIFTNFSPSSRCEWHLPVVLICASLITIEMEHWLMFCPPCPIQDSSWVNGLFVLGPLPPLRSPLISCCFFTHFFQTAEIAHILDTNLLVFLWVVNHFYQFYHLLSPFLMVSFARHHKVRCFLFRFKGTF